MVSGPDRTMDTERRQPVAGSRLRLLDVRVDGDRGQLNFGHHLSGVIAGTQDRSDAARWIAATVVGPRPAGSAGSIEVDGSIVSVSSLPSPLLPLSAPRLVDSAVIRAQWHALCLRHRDEIAAAHAAGRLDSYRIDAALDRARERMWPTLGATQSQVVEPEPQRVEPPVIEPQVPAVPITAIPAVDWATPPDATTQLRAQLHKLVVAYEALAPEPLPEGLLLADAWDAHTMLVMVRQAAGALVSEADIQALETRVNQARAGAVMGAGGVPDNERLRIEACHRVLVAAEAELGRAKRRHRAEAMALYDEAAAAQSAALADAGMGSYDTFLAAITSGGVSTDENARRAAEDELAAARAALDEARQVPDVPTRVELEEREALMRARATELLGHAPGSDPATELRALRVDQDGRDRVVADIAQVLQADGISAAPDPVSAARAFLAAGVADESQTKTALVPPAPAPDVATETPPRPVPQNVVDPELSREVADLEEQRWALDRQLARLEAQLARIDEMNVAGRVRLGAADFIRTLESVIAAYRYGDLLAGRLPLVLDGVLDGLSAETREAAVEVFAAAEAVQTVVVTHDPEVMQSLARAGATLSRWPERVAAVAEEPALESTPMSAQ